MSDEIKVTVCKYPDRANLVLRYVDPTSSTDDSKAITSYVAYGPIRPAPGYESQLISASFDLDTSSGGVTAGFYADTTAQAVVGDFTGSALVSVMLAAGHNSIFYPRTRGAAHGIKLTGTAPWAIEGLLVDAKAGRMLR